DAGATSTQAIDGKGFLEFKVRVESTLLRVAGLAYTNQANNASDIDYGLRFQGNSVEVRERGSYRWDTRFNDGDTFRVIVEDGVVSYARNGRVFYTSRVAVDGTLYPDAALYSRNGTIS